MQELYRNLGECKLGVNFAVLIPNHFESEQLKVGRDQMLRTRLGVKLLTAVRSPSQNMQMCIDYHKHRLSIDYTDSTNSFRSTQKYRPNALLYAILYNFCMDLCKICIDLKPKNVWSILLHRSECICIIYAFAHSGMEVSTNRTV